MTNRNREAPGFPDRKRWRVERLYALVNGRLEAIGRLWPSGTGLARVQGETRRLELLKIGAVNVRDTRRAPFLLSSAHPCVRDGSGSWQPGWTPEKAQGGVPGMGVNHAVELCGTRC